MAPKNTHKSKQIYSFDHGSMGGFKVAHSTPNFIPRKVHQGVETPRPKLVLPKMKPAGSNAQTRAYEKAMNSAFKNTKVFGKPGK